MLRNLIILFAMIGACSFIAISYYSNALNSQAASSAESSETQTQATDAPQTPATPIIDVEALKKLVEGKTTTPSVPDGAVDVAPITYGSSDAPVIIEEFASFTCTHCAHFYRDLLPEVKANLVDTGIAQLRVYSFVRNAQDLEATLLVECQKDDEARQKFTGAILRGQEQWAFSTDYQAGLRTIAHVGGMSDEDYDACMANQALQDKIVASRQWFDKQVKVDGTPFFRIGSEVLHGVQLPTAFEAAIRRLFASPAKAE